MKNIKNITLGMLWALLSLGNIPSMFGQDGSIEFLETYSFGEISAVLDPGDRFFQWIQQIPADPGSAELGSCPAEKRLEFWEYIHSENFRSLLPADLRFAWGYRPENDGLALFALKQPDRKDQGPGRPDIHEVSVQGSQRDGSYDILISFSDKGGREWADLTGKNVGRYLAIVVDGKVCAAPMVRMKITQGKCMISGDFTEQEALDLKQMIE